MRTMPVPPPAAMISCRDVLSSFMPAHLQGDIKQVMEGTTAFQKVRLSAAGAVPGLVVAAQLHGWHNLLCLGLQQHTCRSYHARMHALPAGPACTCCRPRARCRRSRASCCSSWRRAPLIISR